MKFTKSDYGMFVLLAACICMFFALFDKYNEVQIAQWQAEQQQVALGLKRPLSTRDIIAACKLHKNMIACSKVNSSQGLRQLLIAGNARKCMVDTTKRNGERTYLFPNDCGICLEEIGACTKGADLSFPLPPPPKGRHLPAFMEPWYEDPPPTIKEEKRLALRWQYERAKSITNSFFDQILQDGIVKSIEEDFAGKFAWLMPEDKRRVAVYVNDSLGKSFWKQQIVEAEMRRSCNKATSHLVPFYCMNRL